MLFDVVGVGPHLDWLNITFETDVNNHSVVKGPEKTVQDLVFGCLDVSNRFLQIRKVVRLRFLDEPFNELLGLEYAVVDLVCMHMHFGWELAELVRKSVVAVASCTSGRHPWFPTRGGIDGRFLNRRSLSHIYQKC